VGYNVMGIIVQRDDTRGEHAGMFSLDGGMKVSDGFTGDLCVDC
jgi:hypothetical protein